MSFILKAFSPADGVAIVNKAERLRLIRPPYNLINAMELPESAVEDAILNHGFYASDQQFSGWREIIAFLNQELVKTREKLSHAAPEAFNQIQMLDMAPLEILESFLDKVATQLIPQRQFEHAENFLLALLESNASQKHPNLTIRTAQLLKQIHKLKNTKSRIEVFENQYNPFKALAQNNSIEEADLVADFIKGRHGFFTPSAHGHSG